MSSFTGVFIECLWGVSRLAHHLRQFPNSHFRSQEVWLIFHFCEIADLYNKSSTSPFLCVSWNGSFLLIPRKKFSQGWGTRDKWRISVQCGSHTQPSPPRHLFDLHGHFCLWTLHRNWAWSRIRNETKDHL